MRLVRNKTKLFSALFFCISLAQVIFSLSHLLLGRVIDFSVYYEYTRFFLQGINPYTLTQPLNYPPSFLLFFMPFTLLPIEVSQVLFTFLSLVSFFIFLKIALPNMPNIKKYSLLICAILLQLFPTKFTLGMGQVNLFILTLLIASFSLEKSQIKQGILWGVSLAIKPLFFPLAIYFLVRKRFRALYSGIAMFAGLNLLILILRPELSSYFTKQSYTLLTLLPKPQDVYDQSLSAFLARSGLGYPVYLSLFISIVFLIASLLYYNKTKDSFTFFSLMLTITTMGNVFAWQHHFIFVYPALLVALGKVIQKKNIFMTIGLVLATILIGFHFSDPLNLPTTNPLLVSHTLLGSFLIVGILLKK